MDAMTCIRNCFGVIPDCRGRYAPSEASRRRRALDIMGTILFKPYQDLGEGLFFDN